MQTLLEPVAAGQTRFRLQGLAPDGRGIAIGRELLLVFPAIDRLVAFLGAFSEESSLDDLMPTMTIERAARDGGGNALLLRCVAGDGYAVDRIARLAGATGGQLYSGAAATFVRYREREAPFGYDLAEAVVLPAGDVVAVDLTYATGYSIVDRLDPFDLVQRLSLRPQPIPLAGIAADPDLCGLKDTALVLVAPGLAQRVLAYLWRIDVAMAGCNVTLSGEHRPGLLLRIRQPTGRILDVLRAIPGVEMFVAVSPRCAVEIGWRHPIHLASASSCFPADALFLFRGRVGRVERIDGVPRFVDARYLVESTTGGAVREVLPARESALEPLRVEMRMRPSSMPREPRASLVAWEQVDLLRKLVYLLPPSVLAAARVALLPEGVLVLTATGTGGRQHGAMGMSVLVPFGRRLCEVASGILVPEGFELWPRVRPALARQLLGLEPEDHAVYLPGASVPIRLRATQLAVLDAALVGRLDVVQAETVDLELPALVPGSIENRKLGRFALWGFGGGEPQP